MSTLLDQEIASLESKLAGLRRQKLAELQTQMTALQAALGSAPAPVKNKGGRPRKNPLPFAAPAPPAAPGKKRGRPRKNAAPAPSAAVKAAPAKGPKRRGRKRGPHMDDATALSLITPLVVHSGKEGVSGRTVSQATGIFYPRVIKLMDGNSKFKKSGSRKWTRYTAK